MVEFLGGLLKLAQAIAWPLVVAMGLLLYRKPVSRLIDRIERIKGGPVDLATIPQPQQASPPAPANTLAKVPEALGLAELKAHGVLGPPAAAIEAELAKRSPGEQMPWLAAVLARTMVDLGYEWVYRNTFGSQLLLAQDLNATGSMLIETARERFAIAAAAFPEMHKGRTFEQWLAWLITRELVSVDGESIRPGRLLQDFMTFLPRRSLSLTRPG